MKKTFHILLFLSTCLLLMAFQCEDDDNPVDPCENTTSYLNELKTEIEDLASASVCSENFECRFIAFGSKPCGGPWSYLTYSTSIDTLQLTNLVATYNTEQESFNTSCNTVSDCAFVTPPTAMECENNICIPVY
ncbi:hypothetical protein [uncultured Lacinutrix sp.]|uniref:hypothetical protein n=1 Tax=uncultured Lacinutrix sp. TaxID=574032 RepID=UPI002610A854|nr:hypothetical protein [uncultured Lacinutrix sp.]